MDKFSLRERPLERTLRVSPFQPLSPHFREWLDEILKMFVTFRTPADTYLWETPDGGEKDYGTGAVKIVKQTPVSGVFKNMTRYVPYKSGRAGVYLDKGMDSTRAFVFQQIAGWTCREARGASLQILRNRVIPNRGQCRV